MKYSNEAMHKVAAVVSASVIQWDFENILVHCLVCIWYECSQFQCYIQDNSKKISFCTLCILIALEMSLQHIAPMTLLGEVYGALQPKI